MAKSEKKPFWKKFRKESLSSGDMALFLCSFTAIFGILCYKPGGSIYFLVMFGLYALCWITLTFGGGRRLLKGTWITGLVLWGMALVYCLINWIYVVPMGSPETMNPVLAGLMFVLQLPTTALLNPVFPLLYRLGYVASEVPAENAEFLLILCLCCMAIAALSFFAGFVYQKYRGDKPIIPAKKKMKVPMEFKD